ncbi:MAG: sulfatase-like hydrolase/transferase [Lentisphaerae bacterium]|jgi:arylsulfatase A-like enzyme|nr:sulfatase-like hydrolase/transferase [Lentisphaerota bacterium]MBT4817343.1 sulfatase-like hydrolase/transferase [Lentisphaerota bacterium]MBT5612952.1 sulfatase-like hydrolase/transferase [Lentisphaerota bacterium]MBT7059030.1 sulfatase-like hydrolase/transferase [Lentisphaerota bacterium]MBT7846417.1 sulfatase-like hydrolase/transferase [Lentisphaerota bacterium]
MTSENILFILTDQWPSWAFSFRGADIPTPNIDRLAARGTVFSNAFTSCPLCTPARGALLTARWPHQTGVYDNQSVGYSLQETISMGEQTWIDEAARLGYHVGYFGKWHLGANNPEARGAHRFDRDVEVNFKPYDPATNAYTYEKMTAKYEDQGRNLVRGRAPFWGETTTPKERKQPFPIMANGVRFLEKWATGERDKPFFLTVSSTPPHFPHHLPEEYARIAEGLRDTVELPASLEDDCVGRPWFHSAPWWPCMDTSVLDQDEWRTLIAYSHAHIMLVDEAIGRVLDTLERLDLDTTTTVVFTADHGDMEGAHNRFDKGAYFYEEVWRIPLIIRSPGIAPATQEAFVSILDVGETLFSLVGSEADPDRPRFGRDLLPLTGAGTPPEPWPALAYGVYDLYNGINFAVRAIRDRRWKYVWNPQEIDELYDLETDPHEMTNRINDPAAANIRAQLRGQLLAWLEEIGDGLPDRAASLPPAGTVMATRKPGP